MIQCIALAVYCRNAERALLGVAFAFFTISTMGLFAVIIWVALRYRTMASDMQ